MKRSLTTTAALAAAALALTGCGGSGGSAASGESGDVTTLTVWHGFTGSDGPALQQVIDDFNASQDEIKVEAEVYPWDSLYQKVLTSVTSGSSPDIIAMSASKLAQYAAKGVLSPTTDFYADTTYMDTTPLASAAVDASKYDDVNYGVPLNIGPFLLYWNKDLFEAAGLDPDQPPTTWDEFAEDAKKLTIDENADGKPEQYAIAIGETNTTPVYPAFFTQNGGGVVSADGKTSELDSEATLKAANFWIDMVVNDHITPTGMTGEDADQLFSSGKAAMELNGPWLTTGLTEAGVNFGVSVPFRASEDADLSVMTDSVAWTVPTTTSDEKKAAAYTFFAYWNSVEGQTAWANGSGFPPDRSDIPEGDLTNEYTKVFGSSEVLDAMTMYMTGVPDNQTIDEDIFTPALQNATSGSGDVDQLFKEASAKIQETLDGSE
jgi:multiple sugar transport system substrate-binding protein